MRSRRSASAIEFVASLPGVPAIALHAPSAVLVLRRFRPLPLRGIERLVGSRVLPRTVRDIAVALEKQRRNFRRALNAEPLHLSANVAHRLIESRRLTNRFANVFQNVCESRHR